MTYLTVEALAKILKNYMDKGQGDKILLIPNPYPKESMADYVTINKVSDNDSTNRCIYIEANSPEDEEKIWAYLDTENYVCPRCQSSMTIEKKGHYFRGVCTHCDTIVDIY